MAHFHRICYGKRDLKYVYVGEVLEFIKMNFRGIKSEFDAKKASFRGL